MFVASYQGQLIAANVSACFGAHAAYLHGASSGEHANLQPNSLLMWEAIQWAREQGCQSFDLWGIPEQAGLATPPDDDTPAPDGVDGLWGVYRFKRGFSRQARLYAGAYDFVYAPAWYALIVNPLVSGDMMEQAAVWIDTLRPALPRFVQR
jgi:lipid II:glycine glycyltransferase (peptidoglycan interpeptide bridge formation enzyme)